MDNATWAALNSSSTPVLISYSITADDLKGPFVPTIPADMMEKAKLNYLGYTSPLEELAERFHVNPQILKTLNPRATFNTAGEMLIVPAVHAPREAKAAKVVVSKSDSPSAPSTTRTSSSPATPPAAAASTTRSPSANGRSRMSSRIHASTTIPTSSGTPMQNKPRP